MDEETRKRARLFSREWLVSTGSGSFASSTLSLANTRKQHGLFIAPTEGIFKRYLYVSRIDDIFRGENGEIPLSAAVYENGTYPPDTGHIRKVTLTRNPRFLFGERSVAVKKEIFPLRREDSVVIRYSFPRREEGTLMVRPILGLRYLNTLQEERDLPLGVRVYSQGILIRPGESPVPPLFIIAPGGRFTGEYTWYRSFAYREDEKKGEGSMEDLPSPGYFSFTVKEGKGDIFLLFTLENEWESIMEMSAVEGKRTLKSSMMKIAKATTGRVPRLFQKSFQPVEENALSLVTERGDTVLAPSGFPYYQVDVFELLHYVRDFLLGGGYLYQSENILNSLRQKLRGGLLPKYIPENGVPLYCSADTALFFVEVIQRFLILYGQRGEGGKWLPIVDEIVNRYREGTRFHIKMGSDHLIEAGKEGIEATWMDRVREDRHVTPRYGKAVETNAMWYNALSIYRDLLMAEGRKKQSQEISRLLPRVKRSFLDNFILKDKGYLADYVREGARNRDLRPNQIYALSLAHPLVSPTFGRRILHKIKSSLMTPFGLRTLHPDASGYMGQVTGGALDRTAALFNGSVLPHTALLYCEGMAYVHGPTKRTVNQMRRFIIAQRTLAEEKTAYFLPEALDGDPPHEVRGAPVSLAATGALMGLFRLYESSLSINRTV